MNKQPYENVDQSKKTIIINNFLGGIAWGLGATVGLAIVVTLLGFVFRWIDVIPLVENFVAKVNLYMQSHPLR